MRFYISGRGQGKTTRLLEWMAQAPEGEERVMLCYNAEVARHAHTLSWKLGLNLAERQFLTLYQLQMRWHRGRKMVVGIDNLDLMLRALTDGCDVEFVTATGELE